MCSMREETSRRTTLSHLIEQRIKRRLIHRTAPDDGHQMLQLIFHSRSPWRYTSTHNAT